MKPSDFVHLHSHTMFSLLDGACKIEQIAERAAEWGMPAVAMTDHGNLFGAIDFYQAMKGAGVKPIIGCEVYCALGSRFDRKSAPKLQSGSNHLVLLAKDFTGYKNLIKLVSAGYLEGFYYNPRIDKDLLRQHSEGLICLSACVGGEIPYLIENESYKVAQKAVETYLDIFGSDYYLEIQRHGIEKEKKINEGLIRLHKDMGVPLVATNDSHFLREDDYEAHAALVAIQTGKMLNDPNRMCYPTGVYFKAAAEMYELFADMPHVLEPTLEIAEKCNLEISFDEYHAPDFPIPEGFDSASAYLRHLAREGMERRCKKVTPAHEKRLEFELGIIDQTGYPGYFLILNDLVRFAKETGIRAGARGSAVSSLVGYALDISTVDPIEYGLYFERFLNPERISPPDIDLDIADRDREKLIGYVVEKYGRDNVCQIITFGTMGAKGVIRDVGRVLDLPFSEVDKISKLVPTELKMTLDKALDASSELKQLAQDGGVGEKLIGIAKQLEGLARHASIHAAAVVITPEPVTEYMPLYKAPKGGEVMTQYNWHHVEDLGFLKMDFLGLRNLTVLADSVRMIKNNYGEHIDIDNLPLDDPETYALFGRGETTGVFQFESNGMRDYLMKLRPEWVGDIIAMNALYRPGPMQYIPNYIARKNGREPVTYHHPILESTLKETYGVITYQEQVMEICRNLAGFTLGHADGIRKAMGKKLADVMEKYKQQFIDGAREHHQVNPEISKKIWADIEAFSGYGFNKAHSSGYSIVAYQCAYLKAHYPAEFMAANLNSEIGDIDRLVILIEECRRMGLSVLPPDVNESGVDFAAAKGQVRMGMTAIRNVGRGAVEAIVAARCEGGPFESLFDFCERVDLHAVNRRAVESLIKAGAFDCMTGHRAQLLSGLDRALDMAQSAQADRARGQISLFETASMQAQVAVVNDRSLPDVPDWGERERLTLEKEMLGFYLSGHPLDKYKTDLTEMGIRTIPELAELPDGAEVQVGGVLLEVKPHTDRTGRPMAFGTLEDMHGTVDLVVFPDAFEKVREQFIVDALVVLRGRFSGRNGRSSVQVEQILPIEGAREALADTVNVLLTSDVIRKERLEALRTLCQRHPGGCQLRLHLDLGEGKRTIVMSRRVEVTPSDALLSEIETLTAGRAWASKEAGRARRAARRPLPEPEPMHEPDEDFETEDLVTA